MKKQKIELIFVLFLSFNMLMPFPELITLIGLVFLLVNIQLIDKGMFSYSKELIIIFLIGLLGVLSNNYFNFARDVWYFVNPVIFLFVGFVIAKYSFNKVSLVKIIVYASFLLSVIFYFKLIFFVESMEMSDIRDEIKSVSFLVPFGLTFAINKNLFSKQLNIRNITRRMIIVFLFSTIVLSFSRTTWITFFIVFFFVNFWNENMKFGSALLLITVIVLMFFGWSYFYDFLNSIEYISKFFLKIERGISEIYLPANSFNKKDIIQHWRGYEATMALAQYLDGSFSTYILGSGFGTLVDLKMNMFLGGQDFYEIPKLHNSYAEVLIKTGFLGLLFFLTFILKLVTKLFISSKNLSFENVLLGIIGLFFLYSTLVISGPYNKVSAIPIIIITGYLIQTISLGEKYN